ncbi:methyltransferase [Steroidobacter agaridevorans]|uniref:Methyltransferase n=1 Tax=Steroidobacter agaridevorans TaxID=2695856 RepID=A0A829YH28_9GAMM|nr:class I SAM-dependent methyltransferase [Steroidobacter agaridevorans]GFE82131.1 methyltransferase [Steroidobacter agaridevorans]GFE85481.1 methyltransferase [Steroidobacter agaridevorans]
MYRQISECRICKNTQLVEVLDLGVQTLTGVFPKTRAQEVTAGPLKLVKCSGDDAVCGLLQLQHTYDLGELYGDNYGYRSGLNSSMVAHLHAKVRRILDRVTLPGDALILDIGANDSTTLQAYPTQGCTLVGIDPTGAKFRKFYPPHIQLIPEFFSAATVRRHFGERKAAVVTSFSMFYDLEEPMTFTQEIAEVLADDGVWVLEQSYMPTMLQRNSYDTVCHEHLEYYALKQIKWMTDRLGLKIVDVEFNDINGGSFSLMVAKRNSRHAESPQVDSILDEEARAGLHTLEPFHSFAKNVAASRTTLRAFLDEARRFGKTVCALGASTKGNVLLQYCKITEADIARVGEVNPDKYEAFTPGSLLPIVAEEDVLAMHPDYLLVLPWHFRSFFVDHPRYFGHNLIFPLPQLELVRTTEPATTERTQTPRAQTEAAHL